LPVLKGYIKAIRWQISIVNNQSKTTFVVLAVAVAAVFMASTLLVTTEATPKKQVAEEKIKGPKRENSR
jgi:hypothetical protein